VHRHSVLMAMAVCRANGYDCFFFVTLVPVVCTVQFRWLTIPRSYSRSILDYFGFSTKTCFDSCDSIGSILISVSFLDFISFILKKDHRCCLRQRVAGMWIVSVLTIN
jgi:hypothetical protein